jgi:hypothetical protein
VAVQLPILTSAIFYLDGPIKERNRYRVHGLWQG